MTRIVIGAALVAALVPGLAAAQIPVGSKVGSDLAPTSTPSGYDDGGRRDPFVTLVQPKRTTGQPTGHPAYGLAGLAIEDALVTGIVKTGAAYVAILKAPDGKSFMAKIQDHLENGTVKAIDAESVSFTEQAADAMGVVRPREVKKALRATGAGQ